MKFFSKLISTLFLASIFLSCDPVVDDSKVRRFSFALPTSEVSYESIKQLEKSFAVNLFELKDKSFLIIDAASDQDFKDVMMAIEKSDKALHDKLEKSLLDRVYKLEQQNEYSAPEGQLIDVQENIKRYVLTLEIVNDPELKKEYKRVHGMGMAWPEITANMKSVGVRDMEIYIEGYQAYLIMDTKPDFDFAKDGEKWSKLPRESEWQEYVAKFQKVDPQSKATEKWQEMKLVYNSKLKTTGEVKEFEESWQSLKEYKIPDWMKDSKFGIFIHWGPNAVAETHTDWYGRWMYLDSGNYNPQTGVRTDGKPHPAYYHHKEKFGDHLTFGFKDLIPKYTMENFNPEEWVSLFKKAGAQYVVPVAEHHDSFALYESSITPYNAVDMGPKRDIFKDLVEEIRKQGLVAGASSHLAFNWNFFNQQDYFDTGDPKYSELYAPPHKKGDPVSEEWLENVWWPRTKEIIDKYQPDILWFDFFLDRPEFAPYHKKLAAYYYNSGLKRGTEVVLQTKNYKYYSYPIGTHQLDLERSKLDSIRPEYWQTDTSIGKNSWYYNKDWIAKSAGELIADLVDIVSKNGCLLLNIGPKYDGTIPQDQRQTLLEMGEWLELNGEAIYGSTYWKTYGEGPTKTNMGHLSEDKNQKFTEQDIRFTQNNDHVYAFVLTPPTGNIEIGYMNSSNIKIQSIELLGQDQEVTYQQNSDKLVIERPNKPSVKNVWVFKIKPTT